MKVSWPATQEEMKAAGYREPPNPEPSKCACGTLMQFWTTPNGKSMPMSVANACSSVAKETFAYDVVRLHPHFTDCSKVGWFRRGNAH